MTRDISPQEVGLADAAREEAVGGPKAERPRRCRKRPGSWLDRSRALSSNHEQGRKLAKALGAAAPASSMDIREPFGTERQRVKISHVFEPAAHIREAVQALSCRRRHDWLLGEELS